MASSMRLKHKEEAKLVKAAGRQLDVLRARTPARVEDHLTAKAEADREELAAITRIKHKEEAKEAKAARRRLQAIRDSATPLVDDHITSDTEAAMEDLSQRKNDLVREEKRQLKAHRRNLKAVTHHAESKVSASLDVAVERERELLASRRAEKLREQAKQARQVRKALKAMQSSDQPAGQFSLNPASAEVQHAAAVLLQAARRGSLARTMKSQSMSEKPQCSSASPSRITDRLTVALNNRLAQRRQAVYGCMLEADALVAATGAAP